MTSLKFPKRFLWGTASSAHQVEGGNVNNNWRNFEQQPNTIWANARSGLACDWWRNAEQDFDLMQQFGLNAHRLSIEWSRVEPREGTFDTKALDRYREMIGGLRDRGIMPVVALHHFTQPIWFATRGGWTNAESVALFQRYARTVVEALGDLCNFWITINEPLVYVAQTWFRGIWPPRKPNPRQAVLAFRHQLLTHGVAYQTIHSIQPDAHVGYAKAVRLFKGQRPNSQLDRYAAGIKRYLFEHIWFMATVDGRIRPPIGLNTYHHALKDSFDFVGVNYYTRDLVRFHPDPRALFGKETFDPSGEFSDATRSGRPYSELCAEGLRQICNEVNVFGKPIYVMENGLPDQDDDQRPRWLLAHLQQLHHAIQDGCDVRGYFHWTFVDNFEWDQGWNLRFGLVEMDPKTQIRTPRPSAYMYSDLIKENGISQQLLEKYADRL